MVFDKGTTYLSCRLFEVKALATDSAKEGGTYQLGMIREDSAVDQTIDAIEREGNGTAVHHDVVRAIL